MKTEVGRLILDANIMISAVLGSSFSLLRQLFEGGVLLISPVQQIIETRKVIMRETGQDDDWADEQMLRLLKVVRPIGPLLFARYEGAARSRFHERGQPDWPVLAAAMATDSDVWSHDKDFKGSGAPVWSTRVLRRHLEFANA